MTNNHDNDRMAVLDYLYEHAILFPKHAGDTGYALTDRVLIDALASIPDEFHVAGHLVPGERFIQSVIAEAKSRKADPYDVAEFALDLVEHVNALP